jgi:hypothetical protein
MMTETGNLRNVGLGPYTETAVRPRIPHYVATVLIVFLRCVPGGCFPHRHRMRKDCRTERIFGLLQHTLNDIYNLQTVGLIILLIVAKLNFYVSVRPTCFLAACTVFNIEIVGFHGYYLQSTCRRTSAMVINSFIQLMLLSWPLQTVAFVISLRIQRYNAIETFYA